VPAAFRLERHHRQSDANARALSGGSFPITGGFCPLSATDFVLDPSLTVTGAWSQLSFPYATNVTGISVGTSAPTGNKFYRLRKL